MTYLYASCAVFSDKSSLSERNKDMVTDTDRAWKYLLRAADAYEFGGKDGLNVLAPVAQFRERHTDLPAFGGQHTSPAEA